MKPIYPLRLSCSKAAALPLVDRAALRLHLAICAAWPRFERQLLTLRNAMRQWRGYVNGGSDPG